MRLHLILCASVAMSAPGCVLFTNVTFNGGSAADGSAMDGATTDAGAPDGSDVTSDVPSMCRTGRLNCGDDDACRTPVAASSCGASCAACAFANGIGGCENGACAIAACVAGFANCNMDATDGCETNIRNSAAHCGACNRACGAAEAFCVDGACTNRCPTGQIRCGDRCVDPQTNPEHCGGCGMVCSQLPNAANVCVAGRCVQTCNAGAIDCDGDMSNGCERTGTAAHCTDCRQPCGGDTPTCGIVAGARRCVDSSTRCPSTYRLCGSECVPVDGNETHCEGCGIPCVNPNGASPTCVASTCLRGPCNAGYGNCDGNAANGCEARLNTPQHCGACGNACTYDHGLGTCRTDGSVRCELGACVPGYENCDGNAATGCEIALSTDINHCGACNNRCVNGPSQHASSVECMSGACRYICEPGFADCDGAMTPGCETDLRVEGNCGACGVSCATLCSGNSAASCVVQSGVARCQCSS